MDSKLNGVVRQLNNGHFILAFSRNLRVSVDDAWNAWVNRTERDSWFPGVSFADKQDSVIHFNFGDEGVARGRIISISKPSEFVHSLEWEDLPTSEVTWSFIRIDDSNTMIVLSHQNLSSVMLVDWAVGWHVILDDLVAYTADKKASLPDFEELGKLYSKQLAF